MASGGKAESSGICLAGAPEQLDSDPGKGSVCDAAVASLEGTFDSLEPGRRGERITVPHHDRDAGATAEWGELPTTG